MRERLDEKYQPPGGWPQDEVDRVNEHFLLERIDRWRPKHQHSHHQFREIRIATEVRNREPNKACPRGHSKSQGESIDTSVPVFGEEPTQPNQSQSRPGNEQAEYQR